MTLIEILFEYAYDVYHYGRKIANSNLQVLKLNKFVLAQIQNSVDDKGNFLKEDNDDGDYTFIPWGWKADIYRPNDSMRATLKAQADPNVN